MKPARAQHDNALELLAAKAYGELAAGKSNDATKELAKSIGAMGTKQLAQWDERLRRIDRSSARHARRGPWGLSPRAALNSDAKPAWAINNSQSAARIMLHSASGYLRQAALQAYEFTPNDRAGLETLLLRCNDWVDAVRDTALARLAKVLPQLDAPALSQICLFVLDRAPHWQRGGQAVLPQFQAHPNWTDALMLAFGTQTNGPLVYLLRKALKSSDLDTALPELAINGRAAFVRALATQTILTGTARWRIGTAKQWIDKPMGLSRQVPVFATRPINVPQEVHEHILSQAAEDRSAQVRKVAADALIRLGPDHNTRIVKILQADPSRAVRLRMDYFARKFEAAETTENGL